MTSHASVIVMKVLCLDVETKKDNTVKKLTTQLSIFSTTIAYSVIEIVGLHGY